MRVRKTISMNYFSTWVNLLIKKTFQPLICNNLVMPLELAMSILLHQTILTFEADAIQAGTISRAIIKIKYVCIMCQNTMLKNMQPISEKKNSSANILCVVNIKIFSLDTNPRKCRNWKCHSTCTWNGTTPKVISF